MDVYRTEAVFSDNVIATIFTSGNRIYIKLPDDCFCVLKGIMIG